MKLIYCLKGERPYHVSSSQQHRLSVVSASSAAEWNTKCEFVITEARVQTIICRRGRLTRYNPEISVG